MGPTKKFLGLGVGYRIADPGGKKNAKVDVNVNAKCRSRLPYIHVHVLAMRVVPPSFGLHPHPALIS